MIRNNTHSLAVYVLRNCLLLENNVESHISDSNINEYKQLLSYIINQYSEKITVEQAARLVNLSPYYFCHLFKKLLAGPLLSISTTTGLTKLKNI